MRSFESRCDAAGGMHQSSNFAEARWQCWKRWRTENDAASSRIKLSSAYLLKGPVAIKPAGTSFLRPSRLRVSTFDAWSVIVWRLAMLLTWIFLLTVNEVSLPRTSPLDPAADSRVSAFAITLKHRTQLSLQCT